MITVAEEWLGTCGGCEVTILDIGESLLDLLPLLQFVHMPLLADHKYHSPTGDANVSIPNGDLGIISGGIRNAENVTIAQEMRRRCRTIVALGTCANFGGVPALANLLNARQLIEAAYPGTGESWPTDRQMPALLDRVYAVREVIGVDVSLPGCPPTPEIVEKAISHVIAGEAFAAETRSVCDACPTQREGKALSMLKPPLAVPDCRPGNRLEDVRCLMEQGYLCLGPVTRTGCGGSKLVPRCIAAYRPCQGCFGPVRENANPMVDMMGALASAGLSPHQIDDRLATFNRFAGATSRLRPMTLQPAPSTPG